MSAATDHDLAQSLLDAERSGDTDEIMYAENEILARLDYPLNETEQGLTAAASDAITEFCRKNGAE
jgi:hypothetical protein